MILVTDLEGVLIPEIWEEVARETGIADLATTTHDEPDFERLMDLRVKALQRHGVHLQDLQSVAETVTPYPGAAEFLAWARNRCQVMIASDSFHELSEGIVQRMGGYNLFANTFKVGPDGEILGYRLRIRGRKDRVIHSLKEIGFTIVAMGDGYNDEFMFRVADHSILFRAPDDLAERIPGGHRVTEYDQVRPVIEDVHGKLNSQAAPAK